MTQKLYSRTFKISLWVVLLTLSSKTNIEGSKPSLGTGKAYFFSNTNFVVMDTKEQYNQTWFTCKRSHTKNKNQSNGKSNQKINIGYFPRWFKVSTRISHHFPANIINGVAKGSKHPIHPYGIMAIIVTVCGVVNGVVGSTHHRP